MSISLAELLLADTSDQSAALRAWLPSARRVRLSAGDLGRIDSYGGHGVDLHAELILVLPLDRAVWYEAEIIARGGSTMRLGYGLTPAGREIGVWFAAHALGSDRILGPLGPLRSDATGIDPAADTHLPAVRELRAAAGIAVRALLLGL